MIKKTDVCLLFFMGSVCALDIPTLPPSSTDQLAQRYLARTAFLSPETGDHVHYLSSGLIPSRRQVIIKEYYDIASLLTPYERLSALFRLIHKDPLFHKKGLRRTYRKAVKAFQAQADFALLSHELQERIRSFHSQTVLLRPIFSKTQKALIIAAVLSVAGFAAYKLYDSGNGLKFEHKTLQDGAFVENGEVKVEQLMPLIMPEAVNRFKKKEKGYTRISFNQESMKPVLANLHDVALSLFTQNERAVDILIEKEKQGNLNIENDPVAKGIVERLLAAGRIGLYLEAYDRTFLKEVFIFDSAVLDSLIRFVQKCPQYDVIFNKVCEEMGIAGSFGHTIARSVLGAMNSPFRGGVKPAINLIINRALPDGPAAALKNNEPGTWNDGVKPYTLPDAQG